MTLVFRLEDADRPISIGESHLHSSGSASSRQTEIWCSKFASLSSLAGFFFDRHCWPRMIVVVVVDRNFKFVASCSFDPSRSREAADVWCASKGSGASITCAFCDDLRGRLRSSRNSNNAAIGRPHRREGGPTVQCGDWVAPHEDIICSTAVSRDVYSRRAVVSPPAPMRLVGSRPAPGRVWGSVNN